MMRRGWDGTARHGTDRSLFTFPSWQCTRPLLLCPLQAGACPDVPQLRSDVWRIRLGCSGLVAPGIELIQPTQPRGPSAREGHAACALGGHMFVHGGSDGQRV